MQTKTMDPRTRLKHIGGKVAAEAAAGAVGAAVPVPVRQESGYAGDTARGQGIAGLGEGNEAKETVMKLQSATYTAELEPCLETGGFVGQVRGYSHAHSQGETKAELHANLKEALAVTLEEENPGVVIDHLRLNIVLS